jgi:NAD(P)-dependent dehydrogenase (short-subunit alcohol dehydrogenase family)
MEPNFRKTIVITGSTKGIGLGLAEAFLRSGHNVVISSRRADAVKEVVDRLNGSFPGSVTGVACDVTKYEDVVALWDGAVEKFKRVDIWLNNAGSSNPPRPLWTLENKDIADTVRTNLLGTMYCCMVAISRMSITTGGHIYNFEGLGSKGEIQPGLQVYGSTKRAIAYFTKALNRELVNASNVKLSSLSPGIVITDLLIGEVENAYDAPRWERAKWIFNVLAEKSETVCPVLAEDVLQNDQGGGRVAWLSTGKVLGKFASTLVEKRDFFKDIQVKPCEIDYFTIPSATREMTRELKKTVVITGGSRGIGFGLCREFLKAGLNVSFCSRKAEDVQATIEQLKKYGPESKIHGQVCDVCQLTQVEALFQDTLKKFGTVDIWVNNAGSTTTPLPLWQLDHKQIRTVIETNVLGTMYGTFVCINGMKKQGYGQVYNMEGLGSKDEIQVGLTTYGVTKSAVAYLNKSIQVDLGKNPIVQISSIRPGINITEHLIHDAEVLGKEKWEKTKKIFNILGDKPETTTPYLVNEMLENNQAGHQIAWLDPWKITWRFLTAPFTERNLFDEFDVNFSKEEDPHAKFINLPV